MNINSVKTSAQNIKSEEEPYRNQVVFGIQSTISYTNSLVKEGALSKHEGRMIISELTNISSNFKKDSFKMLKELNTIIFQINSLLPDHLKCEEFQLDNVQSQVENFYKYLNLLTHITPNLNSVISQTQNLLISINNKTITKSEAIEKFGIIITEANVTTEGQATYPTSNLSIIYDN